MADFTVNIILKARDEAGGTFDGLIAKGNKLGKTLQGGGRRGKGILGGANLAGAAAGINQLTGLAKGAVGAPLELAANFEAGLNQVNAFSGGALSASGHLQDVADRARELGSTTEFTATEALSAFAVMTQAGFTYEEQMDSIGTVLDFATAGNIGLAKSAGIVGSSLGGFAKDAKEATDIADVMAKTATLTQTDISAMGAAFKTVAPVSKDLGISLRDTSAALGVLGKAGIKGGAAGTSLRSIFGSLAAPTTGAQKQVLKALGISKKDLRKAVESGDLANPLQLMSDAMEKKGIKGARRTTALKAFFGTRRFAQASLLLDSVADDAEDSTKSFGFFQDQLKDTEGSLDDMATIMRTGAKADAKELKSALEELGITVGQELLPIVKELLPEAKVAVAEFAQWARENGDLVKSLGKILIGVVAVGTVLGPILLTLSSLGNLISLAGSAASLFGKSGMPSMIGSMVRFTSTASTMNPALSTMVGSTAGKAGIFGAAAAAGAAGFAFGTWLDETFKISDELAGLNEELSIHNELLAANIGLQIGRSKVQGAALLGDLTDEEQATLKSAQAEKGKLSAELGEVQGGAGDFFNKLTFGLTGRGTDDISEDVAAQDAVIDKINRQGLKRQRQREAGGDKGPGVSSLGADPAAAAALDDVSTGPVNPGGEIRIVIDDERIKTKDIKSGDIPLVVEAGLNLEG